MSATHTVFGNRAGPRFPRWTRQALHPARRGSPELAGYAGAVLLLIAAFSALTSSHTWEDAADATGRMVVFSLPLGASLYFWRHQSYGRLGPMLATVAFACFGLSLTTVASSPVDGAGPALFLIGQCGLIAVILSYPSGHLEGRIDRVLVTAAAATLLIGWLAADAPLLGHMMPVADGLPVPGVLTMIILLAVAARVGWRLRTASRATHGTLGALTVIALAEVTAVGGLLIGHQMSGDPSLRGAAGWAFALAIPAFAMAFVVGWIQARLSAIGALQQVAVSLARNTSPEQIEPLLAAAFDDPSLKLVNWTDGGQRLVDLSRRPIELPDENVRHHYLTEIPGGDPRVAAIVHDASWSDTPGLASTVAALTTIALANSHLAEAVDASQHELRVSRSRIQSAADTERRRIEHDLHDGAQQRIVGLRIKLELARDVLASHGSSDAYLLDGLGDDAVGILDELRALARGVYPPVLALQGPEDALRAAARRAPIAVTLRSDHLPRYSEDVEAAVYFCCLEAMQNAAKHGTPETRVVVTLSHDPLCFEVRDDGPGFDQRNVPAGAGLVHLHDRLAAFDGDLQVISAPGRGTTVIGRIPAARSYPPTGGRSPS